MLLRFARDGEALSRRSAKSRDTNERSFELGNRAKPGHGEAVRILVWKIFLSRVTRFSRRKKLAGREAPIMTVASISQPDESDESEEEEAKLLARHLYSSSSSSSPSSSFAVFERALDYDLTTERDGTCPSARLDRLRTLARIINPRQMLRSSRN